MHLEVIEALLPRVNAPSRKAPNLPTKPAPEIILALRVNVALLQVVLINAVGGREMGLEVRRRVEGGATLGVDVIDVDIASPHLGLTMDLKFVLAPLVCSEEGFATQKCAAVGLV